MRIGDDRIAPTVTELRRRYYRTFRSAGFEATYAWVRAKQVAGMLAEGTTGERVTLISTSERRVPNTRD